MEYEDIIWYLGLKLNIAGLISLSRTNSMCHKICNTILSKKTAENKVREFLNVTATSYTGKLNSKTEIKKLFELGSYTKINKFIIARPYNTYLNCVRLEYESGGKIKIYGNGGIHLIGIKNHIHLDKIVSDLKILFGTNNCMYNPLTLCLVTANFRLLCLQSINLLDFTKSIFDSVTIMRTGYHIKFLKTAIYFYNSGDIMITSPTFEGIFETYVKIKIGCKIYFNS
jgi:hypothetical protein